MNDFVQTILDSEMDPSKDLSSEISPQYGVNTFQLMVEHEDGTLKLFFKPDNSNPETNNRILSNFPFPLSHSPNIHSIMGPTLHSIFSEDNSYESSSLLSAGNPLLEFEGQPARIRQFPRHAQQRDVNPDGHVHLLLRTEASDLSDSRSSELTNAVPRESKETLVRIINSDSFFLMPSTDASRRCMPATYDTLCIAYLPPLPPYPVSATILGNPALNNLAAAENQPFLRHEDDHTNATRWRDDRNDWRVLRKGVRRSDLHTGPGKESGHGNPPRISDLGRQWSGRDKGMSRT